MLVLLLSLIAALSLAVFICGPRNKPSGAGGQSPNNNPAILEPCALLDSVTPLTERQPAVSENKESTSLAPSASNSASGGESKDEKKDDGPVALDQSLPAIQFLVGHEEKINDEWLRALMVLQEKANMYVFSMKKRMAADQNSWKELEQKIHKLSLEGFTVKAGSEEAKQLRKRGETENRIAQQLAKNKAVSKQNKDKA